MNSTRLALLLVAAVPVVSAAAQFDPDHDRAALRASASASYDAATRAAGVPLVPERAAEIKGDLDESVSQAKSSSNTASGLETEISNRLDEMAAELKGHNAPAPASAAKDLTGAAAVQRARWKTLSSDHDDLLARVNALPGSNTDKSGLADALRRSAASLTNAATALGRAEGDATTATNAVAAMLLAQKRALASAAETTASDAEVERLSGVLPQPVSEAKAAVDVLGQEPQALQRTRAAQKLAGPRDLAGSLYSAADRACNRADDFHTRSHAFHLAQTDFDAARPDGGTAADAAKAALDDADRTQTAVRGKLDHPKS